MHITALLWTESAVIGNIFSVPNSKVHGMLQIEKVCASNGGSLSFHSSTMVRAIRAVPLLFWKGDKHTKSHNHCTFIITQR